MLVDPLSARALRTGFPEVTKRLLTNFHAQPTLLINYVRFDQIYGDFYLNSTAVSAADKLCNVNYKLYDQRGAVCVFLSPIHCTEKPDVFSSLFNCNRLHNSFKIYQGYTLRLFVALGVNF